MIQDRYILGLLYGEAQRRIGSTLPEPIFEVYEEHVTAILTVHLIWVFEFSSRDTQFFRFSWDPSMDRFVFGYGDGLHSLYDYSTLFKSAGMPIKERVLHNWLYVALETGQHLTLEDIGDLMGGVMYRRSSLITEDDVAQLHTRFYSESLRNTFDTSSPFDNPFRAALGG
jgi:hypothetical protein